MRHLLLLLVARKPAVVEFYFVAIVEVVLYEDVVVLVWFLS